LSYVCSNIASMRIIEAVRASRRRWPSQGDRCGLALKFEADDGTPGASAVSAGMPIGTNKVLR
jgi:hypothetical protein